MTGGRPRVALMCDMDVVPWQPIIGGFLTGLRSVGFEAQPFRLAKANANPLHLAELDEFAPALVLWFPHSSQRDKWAPYIDVVRFAPSAVLAFDDPFDIATSLALLEELREADVEPVVLTRAALAVDPYKREGFPAAELHPCIDPRVFFRIPRTGDGQHVVHVGGNWWRPRNRVLPVVKKWCRDRGYTFGEAAGKRAWLVGTELAKVFAHAQLVLEIPRFDLPTQSNPFQVPCAAPTPRLQILAACRAFALVVTDNPAVTDPLQDIYPSCETADVCDALGYWLDAGRKEEREAIRNLAEKAWRHHHDPRVRAAQLVNALRGFGWVVDRGVSETAQLLLAPLALDGCTPAPNAANEDGPSLPPSESSWTGGQPT